MRVPWTPGSTEEASWQTCSPGAGTQTGWPASATYRSPQRDEAGGWLSGSSSNDRFAVREHPLDHGGKGTPDEVVHTNFLAGRVCWNDQPERVTTHGQERRSGPIDIYVDRIPGYVANRRCFYRDDRAGLACAMIGYIANLGELQREYSIGEADDLQFVAELVARQGIDLVHHLEGVFSLFLWDECRGQGHIFQDEYGSNVPLYYSWSDGFYFSTSLKWLLPQIRGRRRLNEAAVADFLYDRRIVPNGTTLAEKVCKLVPGQYVAIDGKSRSFRIGTWNPPREKTSRWHARRSLLPCIEAHVTRMLDLVPSQRLACALSGGFDSTLLLHVLARHTEPPRIAAVSIGGRQINEIPQAERTIGYYPGVAHLRGIVEREAFDSLPDIVWRLEGYVFEDGMFLQYRLAQMLAANGLSLIILGEGADQQLDRYRFASWKRWETAVKGMLHQTSVADVYYRFGKKALIRPSPEARLRGRFKKRRSVTLNDPLLDVILKKNGLMLHSFGIQGIYPFLNRELRTLCEALGWQNAAKKFYKQEIARVLGADRISHLVKIGGQTDTGYLIKDRLPLLLCCLETEPAKKFLTPKQAGAVKRRPENYQGLIHQLVYLHLFHELFISGKFDAQFTKPSLHVPLHVVLNGV